MLSDALTIRCGHRFQPMPRRSRAEIDTPPVRLVAPRLSRRSSAPAARAAAVRSVRAWGTACFVGERGQVTLDVSADLLRRQVTLVGSWTFSKQG